MRGDDLSSLGGAVDAFREARQQANMQNLVSRMKKKPGDLLSFNEVSKHLDLSNTQKSYLADIPLDSIVGSVGRYEDFNRQFLPLNPSDADRWARVKVAIETKGLPPIDVYKVGEVFFVLDGNHRVSVARQLDTPSIEAYVTEFRSPISISAGDEMEQLILRAELAELKEDIQLDKVRPWVDITLTQTGRTKQIFEHICFHRYHMGVDQEREISQEEATADWVDNVYLPLVNVIRRTGILKEFPGRAEADLYIWIKKHQSDLSKRFKRKFTEDQAAYDLSDKLSPKLGHAMGRMSANLVDKIHVIWRKLPRLR